MSRDVAQARAVAVRELARCIARLAEGGDFTALRLAARTLLGLLDDKTTAAGDVVDLADERRRRSR